MANIALSLLEVVVLGVSIAAIAIGNIIQSIQSGRIPDKNIDSGIKQFIKYCILVAVTFGFVLLLSISALIENITSHLTALSVIFLGLTAGFAGLVAGKIPVVFDELGITQSLAPDKFFRRYLFLVASIIVLWFLGILLSFFDFPWRYQSILSLSDVAYFLATLSFFLLLLHINQIGTDHSSTESKISDYVDD